MSEPYSDIVASRISDVIANGDQDRFIYIAPAVLARCQGDRWLLSAACALRSHLRLGPDIRVIAGCYQKWLSYADVRGIHQISG